MKRLIKGNKTIIYTLIISIGMIGFQSCNTPKKACGCESDLNGVSKHYKKRYY